MSNSRLIHDVLKKFVEADTNNDITIHMHNGDHFAVSTIKIDNDGNVVATNEVKSQYIFNVSEVSFVRVNNSDNVVQLLDGPF